MTHELSITANSSADIFWFCSSDLHKIVEESRRCSEVRQRCTRRHVAVDPILGVLIPPDALRNNNSGLHRFTDHGSRLKAAAVVEHLHHLPIRDAALSCVISMEEYSRLADTV